MIQNTIDWVGNVTQGRVYGVSDVEWTGISTDSRSISAGNLYVALQGENFDGHDFVTSAAASGAVAIVNDHFTSEMKTPQVVVRNTVTALGDIALAHRLRFSIPVVGITGSVGKTTTRAMVAHVLSSRLCTLASDKNYNNEIGVPQTLFQLDETHEAAVIEMGMRSLREIAELTRIASPNVGVITNIGISHIERLGSQFNIARAKRELIEGLPDGSTAILPRDSEYFVFLSDYWRGRGRVISFGESNSSDFYPENVRFDSKGHSEFEIQGVSFKIAVPGSHLPVNACIAAATAASLNISLAEVASSLSDFQLPSMRFEISETSNGMTVINDAYNAAPDSMQAALKTVATLANGRRRVAILGEMRELGGFADAAYKTVGQIVSQTSIDVLITVGDAAIQIADSAEVLEQYHFPTTDEGVVGIPGLLRSNDVILVKGSRAMQMEKIVADLLRS